jgi:hypothetical protein
VLRVALPRRGSQKHPRVINGPPMANKSKAPHGSKATFVRANPTLAAPELVKLAKQQGISLTVGHVYNIRANDKSRQRSGGASLPSTPALGGALPSIGRKTDVPRLDSQLRTLILRIGLDRADQIFSELRSSLAHLE